jgi:ferredoxin
MSMQVIVDMSLCEGNGQCVVEAPNVFDLDDLDNLILLNEHPSAVERANVDSAVRLCPKRAITVVG